MGGGEPITPSLSAGGGGSDSEARRLFLARLHSTVLKLERREEEEEQMQQQPVGHRGNGQLAGYQVHTVPKKKQTCIYPHE
jgi:hypothetical protein